MFGFFSCRRCFLWGCGGLLLVGLATGLSQEKAGAPPAKAPNLDPSKSVHIERPTENIVRNLSAAPLQSAAFVNPKVEPGKVKWHPTMTAACVSALQSHKPVLLFQMMGKLDDQFC